VVDVKQVEVVTRRLSEEFDGLFSAAEIRDVIDLSLADFADARVATFIPILAERGARHRLRARVSASTSR